MLVWQSWQSVQTVGPKADQPLFRGGVDLLEVQATVLDSSGQPVRDLTIADFNVTLDGKPRAVRSARFFGTAAKGRPSDAPAPPAAASAVSNTAPAPDRQLDSAWILTIVPATADSHDST